MRSTYHELMEMIPQQVEQGERQPEGYYPVKLTMDDAEIHGRYYAVEQAQQAAIWVGGVGGDWDSPAQELYPLLCQELTKEGIASLRLRYRQPTDLEASVIDVLAGLRYLQDQGIKTIALIGHSFGGAVVIQAAAQSLAVRTVVTIATQSYGTKEVPELATQCSLLLLHGTNDSVLPFHCSQQVYDLALDPKQLILYPDAGHNLDEVADEVYATVRDWLLEQLNRELY